MTKVPLKGSERAAVPGARELAPAEATERMEVSVIVRRRGPGELQSRVAALAAGERSRGVMSREEFVRAHGADPKDLSAVRACAAAHGLAVLEEHGARRTVVLAGTVAQFCSAFAVQLHRTTHAGGTYRGRTGEIMLPPELAGVVEAVLGLDNRPQAKPHFRIRPPGDTRNLAAAAPDSVSFSPTQIAELYGFPAGTGAGECVAIIELGGGYRPSDLDSYFAGLGLAVPSVVAVSVDHGANSPTGAGSGPDGEVMLDIEVVGAIANQAKIAVYFAPNTDAGFLDAITTAVHDTTHKPSVISISWGAAENSWTTQAMSAMDSAFQAAAAMGITVCCASGDNGSSDGATDGGDHVDFPASSSFALACGGTNLQASGSTVESETVWNGGAGGGATGGGVSSLFPLPAWQTALSATDGQGRKVPLTMRGVPDVAGDADPATGYNVRVDGADIVIGGTSAVAPLWAGLVACINGIKGKPAGFLNPQLYANPKALRDVTQGNNGDFRASAGWDACTGLGSPRGDALAGIL
ncbi:MAG TPA: S53 family peptidase [Steroidobacteraceae bacterium]|nr:S53 family peptidase [Steroidobacteraceae bacterium]